MQLHDSEEVRQTIEKFWSKFLTTHVQYLGYNRYSIGKASTEIKSGSIYSDGKNSEFLVDEIGNTISLQSDYSNILPYTRGLGTVVIREANWEKKFGIIDTEGNELLECVYDMISIHLDGFVEISKHNTLKSTSVETIINREFNWEDALS